MKLNKLRVVFSVVCFVVAIVLFLVFRGQIFYFEVPKASWNLPRFVWCCSAVCLGFALVAFDLRYHERSPLPEYATRYPLSLLAIAALVFSGAHVFEATSGYVFYYLSSSLCFMAGYKVDRFWDLIQSIIDRNRK